MKIAIESKKKLMFPPASVGFVEMEIDLVQNNPSEQVYNLRIVDTCYTFEEVEEPTYNELGEPILDEESNPVMQKVAVKKILGKHTRHKSYTYSELAQLGQSLQIDFNTGTMTENINSIFRQGLLITTQMECQQGLTGDGKGMYFSSEQDWELVTETMEDNAGK